MSYGKSGKGFCPVSFGLALGLACAISVFAWAGWVMMFGMPADMAGHMMPPSTFPEMASMAGMCGLKGFLFGFLFALLYDCIICCKAKCCNKDGSGCGCGNPSCSCCNKPKA